MQEKPGLKKLAAGVAVALVGALALTAGAVAKVSGPASPSASSAELARAQANCRSAEIGVAAPLTGPAAFLGQEQLSWAQFAVRQFNQSRRTNFRIVQGDTQLSASLARTVARQFVGRRNIMGVVGPSTSQAVISGAGLFEAASLAAVSPSATRIDLTNGQFRTFFRVVPNDSGQARSIVAYSVDTIKATRAVVVDSQDDYSTALAAGLQSAFRARNVQVDRESVSNTTTDFSTIATRVSADAQVVVFATQTPAAAQALSDQLLSQGKRAVVFGTDGAFSPDEFKPRNGFVSGFAPDIKASRTARSLVAAYNRFSRNRTFGTFGPPAYMSATVLMTAINAACRDGRATRAEVTRFVRITRLASILGGTIRFTARGDLTDPDWFVFKVTNGTYETVG